MGRRRTLPKFTYFLPGFTRLADGQRHFTARLAMSTPRICLGLGVIAGKIAGLHDEPEKRRLSGRGRVIDPEGSVANGRQ
jgi:hypothetical protein